MSLDPAVLRKALEGKLGSAELVRLVEERSPYLFSAYPVFASETIVRQMAAVVQAVEKVVALPAYREEVLGHAPEIARKDPGGARGVFFGYDFHVDGETLGVIEVNTNAGGAMLNTVMARAHQACCIDDDRMPTSGARAGAFETSIVEMFRNEWKLAGRTTPLENIAIVDSQPQQQYLYSEFLLFQHLFARHGIHAVIADPSELRLLNGALFHRELKIDLVYNRLTDFMLESAENKALREAYLSNAVVLSPHPQAHALYADKRNLAVFCDEQQLRELGAPVEVRETLVKSMLKTEVVNAANADKLWADRRALFFKPSAGFGSRAAYRGDKVTKRVWQEILDGDYVAQALMVPGGRAICRDNTPEMLKFDIRCYAYCGLIQWTAARMYQGQTTNFRTPGGGFAPVYSLPDIEVTRELDQILASAGSEGPCCSRSCS